MHGIPPNRLSVAVYLAYSYVATPGVSCRVGWGMNAGMEPSRPRDRVGEGRAAYPRGEGKEKGKGWVTSVCYTRGC